MSTSVYKSTDRKLTTAEEKCDRIVDRYLASLPEGMALRIVEEDTMIQRLRKDMQKAKASFNILTVRIVNSQIQNRASQILDDYARRNIGKLVESGEIVNLMDEEDQEKLIKLRTANIVIEDLFVWLVCDIEGLIHSCGLGGNLAVAKTIKDARDAFNEWADKTVNPMRLDFVRAIIDNEVDKLYATLNSRVDIMTRKGDRYLKKHPELNQTTPQQ